MAAMYRTEFGRVRSYFRKKLGEYAAEDAAALVFVRLARAYEAGRDPDLGLVINEVLYDEAREAAELPIPVGLEHDVRRVEFARSVELTFERSQFHSEFDSAMRALPGDERDAYILTELRGLSTREAEGVLSTSYRTVHRRAEAARQTVRREIAA